MLLAVFGPSVLRGTKDRRRGLGVLGAEECGDPRLLEIGLKDHYWLDVEERGNHNVAYQLCSNYALCHAARGWNVSCLKTFASIYLGQALALWAWFSDSHTAKV